LLIEIYNSLLQYSTKTFVVFDEIIIARSLQIVKPFGNIAAMPVIVAPVYYDINTIAVFVTLFSYYLIY
jgi:hypothetical protein